MNSGHLIPQLVYGLCALTSIACALLMFRGWVRDRQGLLFWVGLGFIGLAINHVLLFIDLVVITSVDMSTARAAVGLGAMTVLLFTLIWEAR